MSMQSIIEKKLKNSLSVSHIEVLNESYNHNVPAGSESHFKVTIVASDFESKTLISRHRIVNQTLADELKNNIHALALHTYTENEWQKRQGDAPISPPCRGGETKV